MGSRSWETSWRKCRIQRRECMCGYLYVFVDNDGISIYKYIYVAYWATSVFNIMVMKTEIVEWKLHMLWLQCNSQCLSLSYSFFFEHTCNLRSVWCVMILKVCNETTLSALQVEVTPVMSCGLVTKIWLLHIDLSELCMHVHASNLGVKVHYLGTSYANAEMARFYA